MGSFVVSLLGTLALLVGSVAMAVDVTTCDPLPARTSGVLQASLSCGSPLVLGGSATLDLNGFTLSGGVSCSASRCSIVSSGGVGTVLGGAVAARRVHLDNIVVDCDGTPVGIFVGRVLEATNVTIRNCTGFGIRYGDRGIRVKAHGLDVIDNGVGMELNTGGLFGTDINVSNNASAGVYSGKIRADGITATGNGTLGLSAARTIKVVGANVSGNGTAGVFVTSGRARLKDSVVSGNAIDVATAKQPKLDGVTCATSRKIVDKQITTESWLACAGE